MSSATSEIVCDAIAAWELHDGPPDAALHAAWAAVLLTLGVVGIAFGPACPRGCAGVSATVLGAAVGRMVASSRPTGDTCDMRGVYMLGGALLALLSSLALRAVATFATATVASVGVAAFWYGLIAPFREHPSSFRFLNRPLFPFWTWALLCAGACVPLVLFHRTLTRDVLPALVAGLSVGVGAWHAGLAAGRTLSAELCTGVGGGSAAVGVAVALRARARGGWCRRGAKTRRASRDGAEHARADASPL